MFVETLDRCFKNVCELDIVFNFNEVPYVHMILPFLSFYTRIVCLSRMHGFYPAENSIYDSSVACFRQQKRWDTEAAPPFLTAVGLSVLNYAFFFAHVICSAVQI